MNKIKIYTACRMTGRHCDELRAEADMLVRTLSNYGFGALNPVIEEKVPYTHEILPTGDKEQLERYWRRDKEMIREADILLDYETQNKSDGANQEMGYARFCLWKPVVRVWTGPGALISRIEDDLVVPTLAEAMSLIALRWGTYAKLSEWRRDMWCRSFPKWINYQAAMDRRYGVHRSFTEEM